MKLLIKETLRDVFVISTHSETIGILVTSPYTFKDQNDTFRDYWDISDTTLHI
jgi:hypothetical protein